MVKELSHKLSSFDGEASRVQCFAHIINIVAKSVISQFDTPKKKERLSGNRASKDNIATADGENDTDLQELLAEISDLAGDHEEDELDELDEVAPEDREQDDGWIDERRNMLSEELKALERDVLPARQMLVKVCILVGPH